MKTALVTGGAGFIGRHVAYELIQKKWTVVILDDLSGGLEENLPSGAEFVNGSLLDHELLTRLFDQYEFDYVYHLAAYAAEGLSHFIKRFNYQNNLVGSVNLLNESIKHHIKCFVFTSSIAVYGSQSTPMVETMLPSPEDPYGIAKYAFELELKASKEMFGLDYIIFRPHNVYGEYQNINDPYRNVIGIFMKQIIQREKLTIYGDGQQTRAFSHISDVAPVIAKSVDCVSAYGEVFNIGSDDFCRVLNLAEKVKKAFHSQTEIDFLESRKEVKEAYCSHEKLKAYFEIIPSVPLDEGIFKMAEWVKQTGLRPSQRFDQIEIEKNLPSNWKSK